MPRGAMLGVMFPSAGTCCLCSCAIRCYGFTTSHHVAVLDVAAFSAATDQREPTVLITSGFGISLQLVYGACALVIFWLCAVADVGSVTNMAHLVWRCIQF